MTVRFFVTSSGLMIFSWLAATYFRSVPLESYPQPPALTAEPLKTATPALPVASSWPESPSMQFISTAAQ